MPTTGQVGMKIRALSRRLRGESFMAGRNEEVQQRHQEIVYSVCSGGGSYQGAAGLVLRDR
jgi:hypothetical protein